MIKGVTARIILNADIFIIISFDSFTTVSERHQ